MKYFGKMILIPMFCFLISCSTLDYPVNNEARINLSSENLNEINGIYKRSSINDTISTKHYCPNNLFHSFFLRPGSHLFNDNSGNDFAELEVIDNKRIRITLTENGNTVKSKILKGKIVENTFEFNRRSFIIPLVIMNFYEDRKTRISLLQNGNLSVETRTQAVGSFFIFPWSGGGYYADNLEFDKVK